MTDFLLSDRDAYRDRDDGIECVAWTEDDLRTCPCSSCRSYRLSQESKQVYEDRYQAEMERVKAAASKPFYQGWEPRR